MSSGTAQARYWVLEFAAEGARRKDAYTGWNSIEGTANQVKLKFDTLEEMYIPGPIVLGYNYWGVARA